MLSFDKCNITRKYYVLRMSDCELVLLYGYTERAEKEVNMSIEHTPSYQQHPEERTGESYVYPQLDPTNPSPNPGGPSPMPGGPNPLPEPAYPIGGDDPSPNPGGPDPAPGGPDPVSGDAYAPSYQMPAGVDDNPGGPSPMPGGPNPVPESEVGHPELHRIPVDDPSPNPEGPDPAPGGPNPVE